MTDKKEIMEPSTARGEGMRSVSLTLDLRQVRRNGTYVLETVDKENCTCYTFTLNFNSAPWVYKSAETPEEKNQRLETQRDTYRAKKYNTVVRAFESCASSGRASLFEMAKAGNVSTKSIRRYDHEFSDDFSLKKNVVTRLKGVEK